MSTIGENIAKYRKTMGITQESLATTLGVTPQSISKWENEATMPDILLLPKIAEIFDTDIDSLFGIKRPKHIRKKLTQSNIYEEMYHDFFVNLQYLWSIVENDSTTPKEERAIEIQNYLKNHRNTQTMVVSNKEGNGIYADSDIALIFHKDKTEMHNLFDEDYAWNFLKKLINQETRAVYKFVIDNSNKSFTSSFIAAKCNIDIKLVDDALNNLVTMGLIKRNDVETGDGKIYIYHAWASYKLLLVYSLLCIAARLGNYKESYRGFMV